MAEKYRDAYGMFATNGILFNHESPRRGETFVTRKISRAIAHIIAKKQRYLYLGNLEAKRDWGYAPEYVRAMRLMLQQEKPSDYVVGAGETHSVKEFVVEAFGYTGLGWQKYVKLDSRYFRPLEVETLIADGSTAKRELVWEPKVTFKDLVKIMVDADMEALELECSGKGKRTLEKYGMN